MLPVQGYIKIYRKFFEDDPFWNQPRERSRAEAWIDMIQMAAWRQRNLFHGTERIEVARGEFVASRRFLAQRWNWTDKQVRCFVESLAKRGQVRAMGETPLGQRYLVVNYEAYQGEGPSNGQAETEKGPSRGQAGAKQGPKEEEVRRREEEGEEENLEGTLFESSAPPPLVSAAGPIEDVEVWIPFEGKQAPKAAKLGPWRTANRDGARWEYGVTRELIARLAGLYPSVDIAREVRAYADWSERHPSKRKTYSGSKCGVLDSLHFWLDKRQNANGIGSPSRPSFGSDANSGNRQYRRL